MDSEWTRGDFVISTDRGKLDVDAVHAYLSNNTYWATGRTLDTVARSIDNSLSFGLYKNGEQIGFARVVTDYATFAWMADVFVLESFRGNGLGTWLVETILSHPQLQGFRRWVLSTKDAHEIYRRFGFVELKRPERWMERHDPSTVERPDYWATDESEGSK
jgi:GNAT superfamily N-acetyltransferase